MADEEIILPEEEQETTQSEPLKPAWQAVKESWYDKIPVTVKQLDIIIGCGIAGMVILAIVIALDAMGVF